MYGLQRFGDDNITVDGDGQKVYHRGDAKQGATERVHLTSYQNGNTYKHVTQQQQQQDVFDLRVYDLCLSVLY